MLWIITNVNPKVFDESEARHYIGRGNLGERLVEARNGLAAEAVKPFIQGWAESAPEYKHEFRLLDDDGIVYFEGVAQDFEGYEADIAFWPLDYAQADAGCTELQYRKRGSKLDWETL